MYPTTCIGMISLHLEEIYWQFGQKKDSDRLEQKKEILEKEWWMAKRIEIRDSLKVISNKYKT